MADSRNLGELRTATLEGLKHCQTLVSSDISQAVLQTAINLIQEKWSIGFHCADCGQIINGAYTLVVPPIIDTLLCDGDGLTRYCEVCKPVTP